MTLELMGQSSVLSHLPSEKTAVAADPVSQEVQVPAEPERQVLQEGAQDSQEKEGSTPI